jgi:tRNA-Thr(GGU) m(6)t(6)A37 methyltransferase TsaA
MSDFADGEPSESPESAEPGSTEKESQAAPLSLLPIGRVHSPLRDRLEAPRQPAASAVEGRIELFPASGIEHALTDLDSFRFIWVLFWFHHNQGFRAKVLPPRSARRRGVFATRSPYRPNPIGLSVVELLKIEGRVLFVKNLDILDGSPVLDLKPYLPYTDAIPEASNGWLDSARTPADPLPDYDVSFDAPAAEQLAFLAARGITLAPYVEEVLRLGPQPHPYRRIKPSGDAWVLAYKEWRFTFRSEARRIVVLRVRSGYRPSELFSSEAPALELHREFVARFPG